MKAHADRQPETEQQDFLDWLVHQQGYVEAKAVGETGLWVGFRRLLFHWTLIVGQIGDRLGYEDRWCFQTMDGAKGAFDVFTAETEPQGWHRHPRTGRRRDKGDPRREVIVW